MQKAGDKRKISSSSTQEIRQFGKDSKKKISDLHANFSTIFPFTNLFSFFDFFKFF